MVDKKTKEVKKQKFQTMSGKHARVVTALTVIKVIQEKVRSLKHGYLADDEFAELRRLVQKI